MNWSLFWAVFTIVPLVVFGIFEYLGRHNHTYSETIRRWLGVDPPNKRRRWAQVAFVVVLVGFDVWFIPHILLSIWPS